MREKKPETKKPKETKKLTVSTDMSFRPLILEDEVYMYVAILDELTKGGKEQ